MAAVPLRPQGCIRNGDHARAAPIATAFSFPLALLRAPSVVVVPGPYGTVSNMCPGSPASSSCPGSFGSPQAAPGVLCVYERPRQKLTGPPQLADPVTGTSGAVSAVGTVLSASPADPTKPAYDSGTWAVTTPLPARVRVPALAGLDPRARWPPPSCARRRPDRGASSRGTRSSSFPWGSTREPDEASRSPSARRAEARDEVLEGGANARQVAADRLRPSCLRGCPERLRLGAVADCIGRSRRGGSERMVSVAPVWFSERSPTPVSGALLRPGAGYPRR
jgi:hypothetical protein